MKKTLAMVLAMGMTNCEPDSMRRKQAGRDDCCSNRGTDRDSKFCG